MLQSAIHKYTDWLEVVNKTAHFSCFSDVSQIFTNVTRCFNSGEEKNRGIHIYDSWKAQKLLNELRLVTQLATAVINSTVKRDNTEM